MAEPKPGESSGSISKATIADLKAITAEHVDQFSREGRSAVKGHRRPKEASKNPFDRPSPGLLKRLAAEARNDAKRRRFADDAGPSDDQRKAILKNKAKMYEAMMQGDLSGLSERQIAEMTIDFDRKREDRSSDDYSDGEDYEDESDGDEAGDSLEQVEYEDEMGRTRVGTRKEAQRAQAAKRRTQPEQRPPEGESAYTEVQQSNVIYGDQNMFPVYEPDADVIREKYRAAEEESRAHHYDSTKEVRARGAGQYQFALDEEERAAQMASLKAQRKETEQARSVAAGRTMTAAQEARKRKLDERRAAIEAKRAKLLGGEAEVARLRAEKRAAEADKLLEDIASEMHAKGS